jgi:hypothetical protein
VALLAVDADEPWGCAQAVPPAGDLRAPREALLAVCDRVVAITDVSAEVPASGGTNTIANASANVLAAGDSPAPVPVDVPVHVPVQVPAQIAYADSRGAWRDGALLPWPDLVGTGMRWGLLAALSRPDRVVRALARRGIALGCIVRARDHGPLDRHAVEACARARRLGTVDGWLVTPKCALHLPADFSAPVATLDYSLVLSPSLRSYLDSRLLACPSPP